MTLRRFTPGAENIKNSATRTRWIYINRRSWKYCWWVAGLCRVLCGEDRAEGHSWIPATESWLALEEKAGSSARPSGGLHTHSHIIWSYPHYLSCLFSALQSSVNLHSVAHFVLPPSNIIWGSTSPTCLCRFLSSLPPFHPIIPIPLSRDSMAGPFFYTDAWN